MLSLKMIIKASVLLVLLAIACAAFIYFCFLTPQKRAAKHLEFVHKSIVEMHPAVLDPTATEFQNWYQTGYEKTKALLPLVNSVADERALLNYYFAGYKESHLGGNVAYSRYEFLDHKKEQWLGWILKATANGYQVSYSLEGDRYPSMGMQIVSCDNQPIDEFLQKFYAPYFDLRWNIYSARDRAANALTVNDDYSVVLQRPHINQCIFKYANGEENIFPFVWLDLTAEEKQKINRLNYHPYIFPAVTQKTEDVLWINASDFQLNSPEAFQHHQKMLSDLKTLKGNETLVFDLRSNGGGNSDFGNQILSAAFGEQDWGYLEVQIAEKFGDSDSFYRPSWSFYWSRDYMIKKIKKSQGDDSTQAKWLSVINERTKKALENNEQSFSQKEALGDLMDSPEVSKNIDWAFRGTVIVLTDRNCVSACLDFMDRLKQIPGVHHWGEPTNADTVYTEVATMWHDYYKEAYSFLVPVKQWTKRPRKDNEPYVPDIIFDGNIYDDQSVEAWVLEQIKSIK